jgi:hypothetical protein
MSNLSGSVEVCSGGAPVRPALELERERERCMHAFGVLRFSPWSSTTLCRLRLHPYETSLL